MQLKKLLEKILTKKAKGYTTKEKTEEYIVNEGDAVLVKLKVVTKHIAPDINAVKALLELNQLTEDDVSTMTDQQLEVERLRLLGMLKVCSDVKEQPNKEIDND